MKIIIELPDDIEKEDIEKILENIKDDMKTAICEFNTYTGECELENFSKFIEAFKDGKV